MNRINKYYKIRYTADIKCDKPGIKIWFAKPINCEFQKINNFYTSLPVQLKYQDGYKNNILYFDLPKNKEVQLSISFQIKNGFFEKNINKNCTKIPSKKSLIYRTQTQNTQFLEQTKNIKNLAYSLNKNIKNPIDVAKNIFLYIVNNFKYIYPVKKRGVKNLNLKKLQGDCGEYSAFFATLCRINKIPVKINTGFVVFPKNNSINEHSWNSIYLKTYGWIDIDTQYGSLEKNNEIALKKYFCKRIENRIIFTENYNIPLEPPIPKNYNFSYWRKEFMPMDRKKAQVLQPLIFATKNRLVSFKQNFELDY